MDFNEPNLPQVAAAEYVEQACKAFARSHRALTSYFAYELEEK